MTSSIEEETPNPNPPGDVVSSLFELMHGDSKFSYQTIKHLKESLSAETDRGCALMVGAYLDELLVDFLDALFVEDRKVKKDFLRPDGPLGTFSSRIDICYLLGQISRLERRELHLLRKIRNEFAHTATTKDFLEPVINQRIRELKCTGLKPDDDPRHRLIRSCIFLAAHFHVMIWSDVKLITLPDPDMEIREKVHEMQMRDLMSKLSQEEE